METYLKKPTPEKKLLLSLKLYHSAKALKIAYLRKLYPELTEKELHKKIKEIFLYARS
jgi:hypothetical protein